MSFNEADTRAKLIDPAIHKQGWTDDLICREKTAGTVDISNGGARRRARGKIDYVLRVKVNLDTPPVALALIEASKEILPPAHGLTEAKGSAECQRHNISFVYSSNGRQFVEFDCFTGLTSASKPIFEFPIPSEIRTRNEQGKGFSLNSPAASSGNDQFPDLRASNRSHFIASTMDLLSTGVDVPCVWNIVFFKYLKSPSAFTRWLDAELESMRRRAN